MLLNLGSYAQEPVQIAPKCPGNTMKAALRVSEKSQRSKRGLSNSGPAKPDFVAACLEIWFSQKHHAARTALTSLNGNDTSTAFLNFTLA